MTKGEIESTYKIERRIEGEERGLDYATMVFTSTQQEVRAHVFVPGKYGLTGRCVLWPLHFFRPNACCVCTCPNHTKLVCLSAKYMLRMQLINFSPINSL